MTKKVLVIRFSQTGQLRDVTDQILAPLRDDPCVELTDQILIPAKPFPFPWGFFRFLDAFPESVAMIPPELKPLALTGEEDFDLVILPYQVWYLSPSQPITAFLKHPVAQRVLHGKPVVTVIACRNVWMMAQEKMKMLLAAVGARLVDNVVLCDPGPTMATFITTPRWLLSGRKSGLWGMPAAGLTLEQITGCRRFGLALRDALSQSDERGPGPLLAGLGAVTVDPALYVSERVGTRSFTLWGKLVRAAGKPGSPARIPVLTLYVTFLLLLICTLVPISLTLQAALRPLFKSRLARIKGEFEAPSGSTTERIRSYET